MIGIGFAVDRMGRPDMVLDAAGDLDHSTGARAIAQHVRQALMMFEGEWFLDNTAGVPWLSQILGKRYDPSLAESVIKSEILSVPGVSEITSFDVRFDRSTRGLSAYNIRVKTDEGEAITI